MKTNIVGSEFAKSEAKGITEGSQITITHDKTNQFDEKALAVSFNNERIGYIGKNSDVYDIDRSLFPMNGVVDNFYIKTSFDEKFKRHEIGHLVSCTIEIEDQIKIDSSDNVKSFNENGVVINFNEKDHRYTYNGKVLLGATTYIKKYIQDFDAELISGRCVNAWGIEKKEILNAWNLSGDLASSFGTGIHKALEFEDLYRKYHKKNGDRCFKIKHPVIKRIVDEFFEFYDTLGFKGDVIPEALVSDVENNLCGLADRILVTSWENKTCRIQDYKVNHTFNEKGQVTFENLPDGMILPSTKLSKLSLQLKFHQRMLEKNGWTVEGFDGFVYNESWEYYSADMLDGFDILNGTLDI